MLTETSIAQHDFLAEETLKITQNKNIARSQGGNSGDAAAANVEGSGQGIWILQQ